MNDILFKKLNKRRVVKKELVAPSGYYDENTDLEMINDYVLGRFKRLDDDRAEVDKKIAVLEKKLEERMTIVQRGKIKNDIELLRRSVSTKSVEDYKESSREILEEWRESRKEKVVFGKKKSFNSSRMLLVRTFIQIASNYFEINMASKVVEKDDVCPICRNKLQADSADEILFCESCQFYQERLFSSIVPGVSKTSNADSNKKVFMVAMRNIQGKGNVTFPKDIKERVDDYCRREGIKKRAITHGKMREIFGRLGYNEYYAHVNLFLHDYINKKLLNLGEYEELLENDYDMFMSEYQVVKGNKKSSSLNSNYLLYILLVRRGIECDIGDFDIPNTDKIKVNNDNIAAEAFERLGWKFTKTS